MNKHLGHLILISAFTVAGVVGANSKASAESVDVNFTGTIPGSCSINKVSDGILKLTSGGATGNLQANPDYAPGAQLGAIKVNCNGNGLITLSPPVPVSPAAQALRNQPGSQLLSVMDGLTMEDPMMEDPMMPGMPGMGVPLRADSSPNSANIAGNGTDVTYSVNMYAEGSSSTTPPPPGTYTYTVNVAVTAN